MRVPSGESRGARSVCSVFVTRCSVPSARRIQRRVAPPLPRTKATLPSGPTVGEVSCAELVVSWVNGVTATPLPGDAFTAMRHRS